MIKFEKPEYKISEYNESSNYGKFELEPLERGFGTTIGNALRRVLLSSLPGSSVVSIKIDGVMHEFQKIDGIIEDVTQIVLNVKKLVVKCHVDGFKTIKLSASTEGPVTAGMIEKDADVDIINQDLVICNLVKGGKIDMELTVSNGRGYVEAKTNKALLKDAKVGIIPVDSNYSPIELVKYEVLDTRVGQDETYDKLVMEITTNGSMTPEEAMALSAKILVDHFAIIADLNSISNFASIMQEKQVDTKAKTLETPIEEVEFSVRAYNCLKRHGIHTLQDLVNMKEIEVTKIRNLGKKSLKEVIDKVADLGLEFKE
ncbi:MAG: DNA-directed RNA polymerase subunit alpha [Bacilli bacterium]